MSDIEEMRVFFEMLLGADWELQLIVGCAMAGPDASNDDVDRARERAVAIVEEARPDLAQDDELADLVREAWFTLWSDWPDPSL